MQEGGHGDVIGFVTSRTRTGGIAGSTKAVINLAFWSTLTSEHEARARPRAIIKKYRSWLTSTNADRSRPLNF
jgi:hypothetical protein